ncbi:vWA domain-containing protein [Sulfurovum mangrovi]|uniref:vWA domain-containing protein n=1 Tax=Sulfurovum mangrovi TaxID=2893889 RepID=UPI001E34508D|nr:VWA domain-containing protein [Sulfurovum mangrovi]UFH58356.1 VWA domain-containing protein [Sulfurovum mangrovi]
MKKVVVMLLLWSTLLVAEQAKAMIIFDASGSMWGQIAGKTKIEIAREALNRVVRNWNPEVEMGLIVYGHRSKGDCNDIETVIPVGKVRSDRVISTVNAISPKGKTPISRAIRKAAEALKYTEEKATVILISDGKETCDPDPCGTAKALKQEGIDFVAHVIGFNVDRKTDEELQCIAEATGGEYFSAKNATALNKAMNTIVKKVEVPKSIPKPVAKKLDHTVEISASEREGGKWISTYHTIYNAETNARMFSCNSTQKDPCSKQLSVGKYVVKSSYNDFKQEQTFEINPGEVTKVHLVMGQTGEVEISASETEGGKWINAYHTVYNEETGQRVGGSCHSGKTKGCVKQIPVGKYIVKSSYNNFKQEQAFEIKPGEVTKVHLVMGETGEVEITASETEGGKWINAYHTVYNEETGQRVGGSCHSGKTKGCVKQIPVGKYIVKSSYNNFKQEQAFEIKPGEVTKVHVTFPPFEISTKCASPNDTVAYEVYSSNGRIVFHKKVQCIEPVKMVLEDGSYTVETKVGNLKKETAFTAGSGTNALQVDMTQLPVKEPLDSK